MRRLLGVLIVLVVLVVACGTAPHAAIQSISIPNAVVEYYDIHGETESELRTQMDDLGPVDNATGVRWDSWTTWQIGLYLPPNANGSCDLQAARITDNVVVTFPRWISGNDAPPALVSKWNKYVEALRRHEQGHVDIVMQNLRSVLEAVRGATCGTAYDAAQAAGSRIQPQSDAYDTQTEHGRTQGAVFP